MSEHLIIYLDESGDLGFNFDYKKTSRYLVITLLACWDDVTHSTIARAVRKTLKNKLPRNTGELKGSKLELLIKKYFLEEMNKGKSWCLYAAIADKKAWLNHHVSSCQYEFKKKTLYDETAKRLFSQISYLERANHVDIVIDRSKNKGEIKVFDKVITAAVTKRISEKTRLTIRHRSSQESAGLQAIDIFCAVIGKKYEKSDFAWYSEFSDKIAVEVEYKF